MTTKDIECLTRSETEANIVEGLPFSAYADIPAVNSGAITYGLLSMLHMRSYMQGEISSGDSTARRFGRAAHAKVFEPEQYREQIAVAATCRSTFLSGAKKGLPCDKPGKFRIESQPDHWYCGQHKPKGSSLSLDYGTAEEDLRISLMADALRRPEVGEILSSRGMSEVSLVWKHRSIWLKGRLDRYVFASPDPHSREIRSPIVIDLKKCQLGKANRWDAERAIFNYGWHRQAAMYTWGAEKCLGGVRPKFMWIFVEDSPPYDVFPLQADEETLTVALREIRRVLSDWERSVERDIYPGRIHESQSGGLPVFARSDSVDESLLFGSKNG